MSWPDMMTPWAPGDGCDPLTIDILGGLAYAALTARPHHDPDCHGLPGRRAAVPRPRRRRRPRRPVRTRLHAGRHRVAPPGATSP